MRPKEEVGVSSSTKNLFKLIENRYFNQNFSVEYTKDSVLSLIYSRLDKLSDEQLVIFWQEKTGPEQRIIRVTAPRVTPPRTPKERVQNSFSFNNQQ